MEQAAGVCTEIHYSVFYYKICGEFMAIFKDAKVLSSKVFWVFCRAAPWRTILAHAEWLRISLFLVIIFRYLNKARLCSDCFFVVILYFFFVVVCSTMLCMLLMVHLSPPGLYLLMKNCLIMLFWKDGWIPN